VLKAVAYTLSLEWNDNEAKRNASGCQMKMLKAVISIRRYGVLCKGVDDRIGRIYSDTNYIENKTPLSEHASVCWMKVLEVAFHVPFWY
jgi:hypothetical protein